jgi:hypothetical protein
VRCGLGEGCWPSSTINGYLALDRSGAYSGRDESTDASWSWTIAALDRALRDAAG